MRNTRQIRNWPIETPGYKIKGNRVIEGDFGVIMNGGRVIPIEEVKGGSYAYWCVDGDKEWFEQLHKDGFWRHYPPLFANSNVAQCVSRELVRYAYEKYKK